MFEPQRLMTCYEPHKANLVNMNELYNIPSFIFASVHMFEPQRLMKCYEPQKANLVNMNEPYKANLADMRSFKELM